MKIKPFKSGRGFQLAVTALLIASGSAISSPAGATKPELPVTTQQAIEAAEQQTKKDAGKETFRDLAKNKLGDRFAGIVQEGDTIVVRTKGQVSHEQQEELGRTLPGTKIAYRPATYSKAELDAEVAAITGDFANLHQEFKIHSVGVDEGTNELVAGVEASHLEKAKAELPARYKKVPLRFEAQTTPTTRATRSNSPGIFKAGLKIDFGRGGNYIGSCASAFNMRDSVGNRTVLTAGHCAQPGDAAANGNVIVGTVTDSQFGGDMDVARFSISPASSRWLLATNEWMVPIHDMRTANRYEGVCFAGLTSGHRCGMVVQTNVSLYLDGTAVLTGQDAINTTSGGGDSGAPVHIGSWGVGVVSSGDDTKTYYTPIRRIMDRWGLTNVEYSAKTLVTRHTNKCLDVDLGNWGNGSRIQQWDCWGSDNQAYYIEPIYLGNNQWSADWNQLRAAFTSRCVDFDLGYQGLGGIVHQWDCWGGHNQQFQFKRGPTGNGGIYHMLQARHNGLCLDIDHSPLDYYANGIRAEQWSCYSGDNQLFRPMERSGH